MENKKYVQDIYDKQGDLLGIYLSREVWEMAGDKLKPILDQVLLDLQGPGHEKEIKEPLEEWELLKKNWDFKYELTSYVYCDNCGNETQDWERDEPRRFRLSAANLGGLVAFVCLNCGSKVIKRHFKDYIKVEVEPRKK